MSEAVDTTTAAEIDEEPVLELDDVAVHFSNTNSWNPFADVDTVHAVDDATLEIGEKDVVVLVGESGSGKTTLGKTAIGLQRPTEGTVSYRGQDIWAAKDGRGQIDIAHEEIREKLQIVHQDPSSALANTMTVLELLSEPLRQRFNDLDAGSRRQRIYNVLEEMRMTPAPAYAARYPHQLSGGEKQRVTLARALLMDPEVVLADEAVSALDVSLRLETMDLMLNLQDEFETSYIFISHNLSNARYLAEKAGGRVGVMYLGRIVELGEPQQIVKNPKHPYTRVLKWATPSLALDAENVGEPPVRQIDIPDATNPPSGCRFHTRCPYARETCTEEVPSLEAAEEGDQDVACFRQYGNHPYWQSDWIDETAAEQARQRDI